MIMSQSIIGRYVLIRSMTEEDAEFSVKIRQDKEKTKYLHQVDNNVARQIEWIQKQRGRPGDYFFIAESLAGEKVGTVGIYDIKGTAGHLGRLLMTGNPFQTFEGILLSMQFAYHELLLDELYGDVHADNRASLNISEAFGFHFKEPVYDPDLDRLVRYGISYRKEFPEYEYAIQEFIYRD